MARSTPLPIPSHEGDFIWSDSHSMSSEDGLYARPALRRSPSPSMPTWVGHGSTSVLHTGQLSPVSPGMDPDGSSVSSTANSAASSYTDSWSLDGLAKDDVNVNTPWTSDDAPVPKVEVMDDDEFDMNLLERVPAVQDRRGSCAGPWRSVGLDDKGQKLKRPRGRPRKHPLTPVVGTNKAAKGRSKTGCITCRKRKKKCDEAKPRCMNCEKNAVVCEGYHEKQIWKSGKERAEEARLRRESLPLITMPPIFHGVETAEDKIFWRHYCNHLGNVLTVEGEHRNAFKDMILQLATRHRGLMHSILNLSAGHMDYEAPYGLKVLREAGGNVTAESLQARADFHHEEAMRCLYEDMTRSEDKSDPEYMTVLTARYGQMLCLLLRTVVEGNPRGEHRVHLQAYRRLIDHFPPEDARFLAFITEFFEYHIFADELLSRGSGPEGRTVDAAAGMGAGAGQSVADWSSSSTSCPHPPRLIGVADGLFGYMSEITRIREAIRVNVLAGADQVVDYPSLYRAAEIDAGIRRWAPSWPPGDTRDKVALLYQQTMWVYLFRTIYPPGSSAAAAQGPGVFGLGTVKESGDAAQGIPPFKSASGDTAQGLHTMAADSGDVTPSRAPSPPPIRRPESQDPRITVTVEESLSILESFKPSDPSQRLLLIPCLILGTACFTPAQQERVRTAVRAVRGYTGMGNCDLVTALLDEVWALMGRGEWMKVWDWEGVARDLGLDFLCA